MDQRVDKISVVYTACDRGYKNQTIHHNTLIADGFPEEEVQPRL